VAGTTLRKTSDLLEVEEGKEICWLGCGWDRIEEVEVSEEEKMKEYQGWVNFLGPLDVKAN